MAQPLRPPSPPLPMLSSCAINRDFAFKGGDGWKARQVAGSAEEKGNTKIAEEDNLRYVAVQGVSIFQRPPLDLACTRH